MKITIIGAGNMGGSIARGLVKGGVLAETDITVADLTPQVLDVLHAEHPGMGVTTDNQQAVEGADMVLFAVKPWLMEPVVSALTLRPEQEVLSVAAGVTFERLFAYLGNDSMTVFRLIPNTGIRLLQSLTVIDSRHATAEQVDTVLGMFSAMGTAMLLPEEKFPAATALASCGIAYALQYIQAAMQAGIELGIYPKDGMRMVAQSVKGAAELILQGDTHPKVEIDRVCTPGGVTIRGINELEHAGFTSAVIRAIKASV